MEYQHEVSGYRFALLANNANGQTVGSSAPRAITNKLTQKKIELIHWPTAKIVSVESEQNNSLANTR